MTASISLARKHVAFRYSSHQIFTIRSLSETNPLTGAYSRLESQSSIVRFVRRRVSHSRRSRAHPEPDTHRPLPYHSHTTVSRHSQRADDRAPPHRDRQRPHRDRAPARRRPLTAYPRHARRQPKDGGPWLAATLFDAP